MNAAQYCQIIAQIFEKIEKKLGIKFRVEVHTVDNKECLWVFIVAGSYYNIHQGGINIYGRYCEDSDKNLNILGLDFDEVSDYDYIDIVTVVGSKNNWYNQNLFPKLFELESNNSDLAVSKYHRNCIFQRKIRINKFKQFIWVNIKNYDSVMLIDYLTDVINKHLIYYTNMSPDDCINELQHFMGIADSDGRKSIQENINKLQNSQRNGFNWLEYFHIFSKIKFSHIINYKDTKVIVKLEEMLEFHAKGMLLLDYIYRNYQTFKSYQTFSDYKSKNFNIDEELELDF